MNKLAVGKPVATDKHATLKGMPLPQGQHIRFGEEGEAEPSPTSGKVLLRGVPLATGKHMRFD
jgi:hypothetical protein